MKLLLTSAGLENKIIRDFATSQISEFKSKTVGVIITGQTAEERIYIDQSLKELRDLGMTTISMNISKDDNFNDLAEFDMYYVCGGNTFYILDRIRKTGVDNILLKAIKKDKLYIGVSAGSIIMAKNIKTANVGKDGDDNEIGLKDISGFNIIPFHFFPHYDETEKEAVEEFYKTEQEPIMALTDDQAIFIDDDSYILIGNKGGIQMDVNFNNKTINYD
ncbi:MAG: hypothetical protein COU51_03785 [Parcubacteria group bacterium CG10_big_fil_rev_8_21_14_0_10_36_14]|nr:MAG: hypothetical protein COU51_03785 [Parcubacteria group bacterium CG10_big_fil_rev_8_21_14_0_10_36_14]